MKDLQEFQKEINSFFDGNLLKRKGRKNSNSSFSILRLILFYFRSKSETSPLRMIFFSIPFIPRRKAEESSKMLLKVLFFFSLLSLWNLQKFVRNLIIIDSDTDFHDESKSPQFEVCCCWPITIYTIYKIVNLFRLWKKIFFFSFSASP